ncbi:MAG: polysaccharide pyruvyl transferase family protein [Candidatus Bathyarchaeia archaeon]
MSKPICIHVLEAAPRGNIGYRSNIGTIAAQRALYSILTNLGKFDISVSTRDPEDFSLCHPEYKDGKIYRSLRPSIGSGVVRNNIQWVIFNFLNLSFLIFLIPFINLGIFRAETTARMKECDAFIDLNLEYLRGIPISTSLRLIKQKPRILIITKLFWSLRMLTCLWFIFIIKSIFKKKLIMGPASFGPFKGLPLITRWLVRFILKRFVDLILVREPYSAKLLDELGVKNYVIMADVALIVKVKTASSHHSSLSSKLLFGVAPAMLRYIFTKEESDNYVAAHAKCLDDLANKYDATIVFLPSSSEDKLMCEMIRDKMSNKHHTTIIVTSDVDEYETWIKKLDLLITTRMHPSIIAARNFIPFCSIIYDHKQIGVLQQIGLQSFSIPINKVSYHNLRAIIEHAIQNQSKIKEILKQTLPNIQDKSMTTFKIALSKIICSPIND